MPVKRVSDLRFCLIQTKATVLNVKPHASMTPQPSCSIGKVIQRKRAQSGAARAATGSALISAMLMVE